MNTPMKPEVVERLANLFVREALADYAHRAWSGWMEYLFSKSVTNDDGSVTIPATLVARWRRQVATPYAEVPENEQASDLAEADKMLAILRKRGSDA